MNPTEINPTKMINGAMEKNRLLSAKNDEYKNLAEKKAEAERTLNVQFAKTMLNLKASGNSVTMIKDLTKGDVIVSELKYKHDIACAVFDACRESIKDLRTQIDTYRSLLTWLREEKKG